MAPLLERTTPASEEAEQGILASAFIDPKRALDACAEAGIQTTHFYYPAHGAIYGLLAEFWRDNEPLDVITFTQVMRDREMLNQCGGTVRGQQCSGVAFLTELATLLPTAMMIDRYIEIVKGKAIRRQIITECTAIVSEAYSAGSEDAEIFNEAEAALMKIVKMQEGQMTHTRDIRELVMRSMARLDQRLTGDWRVDMPTGIKALDEATMGFKAPMVTAVCGLPSDGKAQPLDAMILTPSGFVKMGDIKIGMDVLTPSGIPAKVIRITPRGIRPISRVILSDGTETRCCQDHLWFTTTKAERTKGISGSVKVTADIAKTVIRQDGGRRNHALPQSQPIHFAPLNNPILLHPWLMGALIGDGKLRNGNTSFCKPEADVQHHLISVLPECDGTSPIRGGLRIRRKIRSKDKSFTKQAIEHYGLSVKSPQKFIPPDYLFANCETRIELLRGLIDTDGSINRTVVEYSTTSMQLAKDVSFLARSLGMMVVRAKDRITKYPHKGEIRNGKKSARIQIHYNPNLLPFSSAKHVLRSRNPQIPWRKVHRSIVEIRDAGEAECQCITIDSPYGLYLTDDFIPTHNSSLSLNIAENLAIYHGKRVGIISLDDSDDQVADRLIQQMARVSRWGIEKSGSLSDWDRDKITHAAKILAECSDRLFIRDDGGLTPAEISATFATWKAKHGLDFGIIDHIQLARGDGKTRGRTEEAEQISRSLKPMAKRFGIPLLVLSQVTQGKDGEYATKNSRALSEDANNVWAISRVKDSTDAFINISKQKDGPRDVSVPVTYLAYCTRFVDREKDESAQPDLVPMAPPPKKSRK
jgi:replicative DNA helicase